MSMVPIEVETDPALPREAVVGEAMRTYEAQGDRVVPLRAPGEIGGDGSDPLDFFVPRLRRLEAVAVGDDLERFEGEPFAGYREDGLELWVLVPVERMGEAHHRLRGHADRIQGWWVEDGRLKLGRAEWP